jgi:glutaredoxin-like protein NrdH
MSHQVTVYTRPGCPYCRLLKGYLGERHVPYQERDVTRDRGALDELRRINAEGVPVTVIDRDAVIGFDKVRLDDLLKAKGVAVGEPLSSQ